MAKVNKNVNRRKLVHWHEGYGYISASISHIKDIRYLRCKEHVRLDCKATAKISLSSNLNFQPLYSEHTHDVDSLGEACDNFRKTLEETAGNRSRSLQEIYEAAAKLHPTAAKRVHFEQVLKSMKRWRSADKEAAKLKEGYKQYVEEVSDSIEQQQQEFDIIYKNCRLCQKIPGCIDLCSNEELKSQIVNCTNLNVFKYERYPTKICETCKDFVEKTYVYLCTLREVDQKLSNYYKKLSPDVIIGTPADVHEYPSGSHEKYRNDKREISDIINISTDVLHEHLPTTNSEHEFLKEHDYFQRKSHLEVDEGTNKDVEESKGYEMSEKFKGILCSDCGQKFVNKRDFKYHKKKKWLTYGKYDWQSCKQKQRLLKQRFLYLCSVCGKKYMTKEGFKQHEETHVNLPSLSSFLCKFCSKSFSDIKYCRRHERRHTSAI